MSLQEEIEAMIREVRAARDREKVLVQQLEQVMASAASELSGDIERVMIDEDARRAAIVRKLYDLANRIGHYPPINVAQEIPPPMRRHPMQLPN